MLFNSNTFLAFFAAFLLLYWLVRNNRSARNQLLVAASCLFYGWWDWRFLGLLLFTASVDFWVGLRLSACEDPARRRRWLCLSLGGNLGVLGLFKYFGFFSDSFHYLLALFGVRSPSWTWSIVLPLGISFYTFQALSYTVDVYRRQIPATRDPVGFLAFILFFPQLVAGPIERAGRLLPQFHQTRVIDPAAIESGWWLILWGMFKKVVLADNLAPLADLAFTEPFAGRGAGIVLLGTAAFAGQIYGDFSGYSDIARGLARWLGFELCVNFREPWLATNLREFWRHWHVSLSSWFRDYLYIPLGGDRRGPVRTAWNLGITLTLAGLWHGASWHFVLWGAWHGLGLIIYRLWKTRGPNSNSIPTGPSIALAWWVTTLFVGYGWLLFRAVSMDQVLSMTLSLSNWNNPRWLPGYGWQVVAYLAPLGISQWVWHRFDRNAVPLLVRAAVQTLLLTGILLGWSRPPAPFIYFQF